jgi:hypothetical protein
MSTATGYAPTRPAPSPLAVGVALAAQELRRMLRNPFLPLGLGFALWLLWSIDPRTEDWAGSSYEGMAMSSVSLMWAISVAAAVAFHRERVPVAVGAPVPEVVRVLARLAALVPLLALAGAFSALVAWRQRDLGGLPVGTEPGRTLDALHSAPELLQHVALGALAIALGAVLGRRMRHLAAVIPLLFLVWYLAGAFYWLYGHPVVTPFSLVQVQPTLVIVGPSDADPMAFPQGWLLSPPGEYQDGWGRLFVSTALAWWHNIYLLGLSMLLLAAAWPRSGRRALLAAGAVLAVLGVVGQFQVIP